MMGEWQKDFCFTYYVAHEDKKKADGMVDEVRVPVWPSLMCILRCEKLFLKLSLYEWAEDVYVDPHPSIKF